MALLLVGVFLIPTRQGISDWPCNMAIQDNISAHLATLIDRPGILTIQCAMAIVPSSTNLHSIFASAKSDTSLIIPGDRIQDLTRGRGLLFYLVLDYYYIYIYIYIHPYMHACIHTYLQTITQLSLLAGAINSSKRCRVQLLSSGIRTPQRCPKTKDFGKISTFLFTRCFHC